MLDDRTDLATFDPEFTANPFPIYACLRDARPVSRVVYHGLPCWLVTGQDTARRLLTDPILTVDERVASARARAVPWVAPPIFGNPRGLLTSDGPDHARLRRLVAAAFTGRRIEELRPRVQHITRELIDAFAPAGQADLIDDFAAHLPAIVIMELLGVPPQDRADFAANCHLFTGSDPERLPQLPAAITSLQTYIAGLIELKREHPEDDLLTKLITMRDQEDRLAETELQTLTFLLLMAGLETVMGLIGNGVLALLLYPEQLARLRADPALLGSAIEEMLRFDGPAESFKVRYARRELSVGGVTIQPGDPVVISASAVNHDPHHHENPDLFDITRAEPHLGFGHGAHYCLGAPLARMEARIAISALLERCRDLTLTCPPADLAWRVSPIIRSLDHLPVAFTPEQGAP